MTGLPTLLSLRHTLPNGIAGLTTASAGGSARPTEGPARSAGFAGPCRRGPVSRAMTSARWISDVPWSMRVMRASRAVALDRVVPDRRSRRRRWNWIAVSVSAVRASEAKASPSRPPWRRAALVLRDALLLQIRSRAASRSDLAVGDHPLGILETRPPPDRTAGATSHRPSPHPGFAARAMPRTAPRRRYAPTGKLADGDAEAVVLAAHRGRRLAPGSPRGLTTVRRPSPPGPSCALGFADDQASSHIAPRQRNH